MGDGMAWAQAAGGGASGGGNMLTSLIPFLLVFVLFYFMLIRPQQLRQKKAKEMLEALKKGDKVVTSSGIWGTVTNLGKQTVTLQIGDNTKVKIQRDSISRIRGDEED